MTEQPIENECCKRAKTNLHTGHVMASLFEDFLCGTCDKPLIFMPFHEGYDQLDDFTFEPIRQATRKDTRSRRL